MSSTRPAPWPVFTVLCAHVIFAGFFFGWHCLAEYLGDPKDAPHVWAAYVVPIGLGLLTCLLFDGMVFLQFANAHRGKPWLIYDKTTGRVELPRKQMSFERKEIVQLQYITTKSLADPSNQGTWDALCAIPNST